MGLVSGRPISFQMNLYDPLFIKRPVVEPELFASLRPVAYSGGLEKQPFARTPPAEEAEKKAANGDPKKADKPGSSASASPYALGYNPYPIPDGHALETRRRLDERMD